MFDRDTLIISYDSKRGEPRGSRARGVDPRSQGLGDCVDCTLCVQACPTGIDIRQGLQLECIACAACIDACDSVMDRLQYPRGLIRYTTQNTMDERPSRVLRPRVLIYAALLGALVVGFALTVAGRDLVELDVLRDRNALYRQVDADTIENVYTVRLVNKDNRDHQVQLQAEGLPGLVVDTDTPWHTVAGTAVLSVPVRVQVPASAVSGGKDIYITARSADGRIDVRTKARFIAPATP